MSQGLAPRKPFAAAVVATGDDIPLSIVRLSASDGAAAAMTPIAPEKKTLPFTVEYSR